MLLLCYVPFSVFSRLFIVVGASFTLADNVSGLCDGGAKEAQNLKFAQMLKRRTTVELCSFAPLLQNPC
ncbi:hypothetical protein [Flectobacillus rivi]|uniref:Secreted protein n=1 Tax=Flectobacillus rivi TaxID=2984209 RepID=A0ABT6Z529_9BACT|nr:hypothetical protein [Flectobacillus rivi]MDI9876212.1 hypothetical protein [Flectobacillus rivi]